MSIGETRPGFRPANCCANCGHHVSFPTPDESNCCCNLEGEVAPQPPWKLEGATSGQWLRASDVFHDFVFRRMVWDTWICDLWKKQNPPEVKP